MVGVFLNAGAQLFLKAGMTRIGHFEFEWSSLVPVGLQAAMTPTIIAGLSCYVCTPSAQVGQMVMDC